MLLLGSFRARQNVELIYASMLHLAVHKAMSTKAKKLNSVSFQDFKLGNQCNRGKSTEFGTSAVQIFSPKTEQYEGLHKSNLSYSPGGNKLNSVPCLHCNLAYQNFSEMQNHYLQTHMVDEFLTFKPLQQSSRGFREFCMNYFQQLVSKCNLEEPVCSNGAKCCYLECKSTFKDSLHLIKHLADKHKPEVVLDLRIALKKHARGESRGHFIGYAISTLRKPKETKKGISTARTVLAKEIHLTMMICAYKLIRFNLLQVERLRLYQWVPIHMSLFRGKLIVKNLCIQQGSTKCFSVVIVKLFYLELSD